MRLVHWGSVWLVDYFRQRMMGDLQGRLDRMGRVVV